MELRNKEVKPNALLLNDGFLVNKPTRQLIFELSLTLGERVANTQGILLPSPLGEGLGVRLCSHLSIFSHR